LGRLIETGLITEEQILKIDVSSDTPHKSYNAMLLQGIDIALLGVGPDSHTCSLFPNHSSSADNSVGIILVEDSPKPPSVRISISKYMLSNVEYAFAFFIGNGKKEAYTNFLSKSLNEIQVPIKIIKNCRNSLVFTNIEV